MSLLLPVFAGEKEDKILFLHLRIDQNGVVRVIESKQVPGTLKTPRPLRGHLKLELRTTDDAMLWSGAVEDPRVRHFEIENPPGSGNLERRSYVVPEAEFMVRVPAPKAAAKFLVFEEEGPKADGKRQRKVLLEHPVPAKAPHP